MPHNPPPSPPLPLQAHLMELKQRLLKSLTAVGLGCIAGWFLSPQILAVLRKPIEPFLQHTHGALIFTAPGEAFTAHLQTALAAGVLFSSPYWLRQVWRFIAPGLYEKEKHIFFVFWTAGVLFFLAGAGFAYFVVFPITFGILIPFGGGVDQAFITLKNYLSFLIKFIFIFGLIFEMPLVLAGLCKSGVLSLTILKKYRKHAIVCLALVSALATPPDILSQLLALGPLIVLYELSIIGARFFIKK